MNRKLVRTPRQLARKLMHREPQSPKYVAARDFRRLGLPQGEARADLIRRALLRAIQTIATSPLGEFSTKLDRQVSLLVHSAYLLLDPRRRSDLMERVQLAYPLGREEAEVPTLEGKSLLVVPSTWLGSTFEVTPLEQVIGEQIDQARADESSEQNSSSGSGQLRDWVGSVVDGAVSESLEESRAVVRLIREEVEEEKKEWFLPWRRWIGSGFTGLVVLGALLTSWRTSSENPAATIGSNELIAQSKVPSSVDSLVVKTEDTVSPLDSGEDGQTFATKLIAKSVRIVTDSDSSRASGNDAESPLVNSDSRVDVNASKSGTESKDEGIASGSSTREIVAELAVRGEPSRVSIRQARARLNRVLKLMSEAVGPVLDQSQRLMELECLVSEAPRGSADQWVLYETLARQTLRAKGLEAAIEISDAMDSEFGIANWDLKVDLVERSSARAVSTADHRKNTLVALRLAKQASLELQVKPCERLLRIANNIALRCNDSGLVLKVNQCSEEIRSATLPSS